ncbi:MAG TPA: ribonucleotide-diphosphate reductase subunit beta [Solirubrobacteraceae bacterium]|nr:ribonucleotide-diphosphate reductase subunit beta [Solirubrobacteraceae bacterium]
MPLATYPELLRIAERAQWSEEAVDLEPDRAAWPALGRGVREALEALLAGFLLGEQAVARDIAAFPAAARERHLAACLTVQEGDERRHARFMARVHERVLGEPAPAALVAARARVPAALVELLDGELPARTARLLDAPAELPQAAALYHGIVEGVVFLAGQAELIERLERVDRLPGLLDGVRRMQRDERWHVALGARLLAEHGGGDDDAMRRAAESALGAWGDAVSDPVRRWALAALERRLATQAPRPSSRRLS